MNGYTVLSPDGVPIAPVRYATRDEAWTALAVWCQRYAPQGYYASVKGHVPLDELPGRCTIVGESVVPLLQAALVITKTPTIWSWLTDHDPKALAQLEGAIEAVLAKREEEVEQARQSVERATHDDWKELLEELLEYFDDRMDINWEGGPNAAMQWHRRITEVLR